MNEIRPRDRQRDEVDRIREIVARHKPPEFVTGFDVRVGEFDGDPAMWIVFKRVGSDTLELAELKRRASLLNALYEEVRKDLLAEIDERYPYFRSEKAERPETPEL